jgi:NitT/TauT family transport system permease protein
MAQSLAVENVQERLGYSSQPADGLTAAADWLPAGSLVVALLLHQFLPDRQMVFTTASYTKLLLALLLIYLAWPLGGRIHHGWRKRLRSHALLAAAAIGCLTLYEVVTLKLNILFLPFFPSPVKILEAFLHDGAVLAVSVLHSLRLLVLGFAIGALIGLPTGLLMGWYARFRYWANPIIRLVGPIPATAWIPVVMAAFPTSLSAGVFLLALAAWFPVTVMTWSGVSNVSKSYFEIARTLGADERYLILKIALPAALPIIFVGLFMGLGMCFVTLIVAEMLGVRAGLGWYIQWAQGWGEYYKVYAAILISAVLFSSAIALLFRVRDRLLVWQRGLVKW